MSDAYSLWLMPPEGSAYAQLKGAIDSFAKAFDAPQFEPHITILGGIENRTKKELLDLAHRLSKFDSPDIKLKPIRTESHPRRPFYFAVENNLKLSTIRVMAEDCLKRKTNIPPHLSLVYGTFTKPQIVRMHALVEKLDLPTHFKAGNIELWRTPKNVSKWKRIGSF